MQVWKRKILACNFFNFPKLSAITEEACFKEDVYEADTKTETKRYFPNLCDDIFWLADPFHVDIDLLSEILKEQALEIKKDSAQGWFWN